MGLGSVCHKFSRPIEVFEGIDCSEGCVNRDGYEESLSWHYSLVSLLGCSSANSDPICVLKQGSSEAEPQVTAEL